MKRWIFNAAAGLSLVLCLGTVGLWVDSYHSWRFVQYRGPQRQTSIASLRGAIAIVAEERPRVSRSAWNYEHRSAEFVLIRGTNGYEWRFRYVSTSSFLYAAAPHWFPALLFLVLPGIWAVKRCRRRIPPGHCKKCGYDLRGSTERCPECGTPIPIREAAEGRQ